jgi:hypothetical protein
MEFKNCLTKKVQWTAGIYAVKALEQHLCERFNDPDNVHVFIPSVEILCRLKFCIQEVLMYICLPSLLSKLGVKAL